MYSADHLLLAILFGFSSGAVVMTIINACSYHTGVIHGWKVANRYDNDSDLDGAREIIAKDCDPE